MKTYYSLVTLLLVACCFIMLAGVRNDLRKQEYCSGQGKVKVNHQNRTYCASFAGMTEVPDQ